MLQQHRAERHIIMAYKTYRENYATFLFDVKNSAEELSTKMGIGGMDSLYAVAAFEGCEV